MLNQSLLRVLRELRGENFGLWAETPLVFKTGGRGAARAMRGALIALAGLTACLPAAEAAEAVDLDFSQAQTGCLPDKLAPGKMPALITTFSAYGRLRGESALPEQGKRYPSAALGRSGELSALRLGDVGQKLGTIGHVFQAAKPFALELWVYVYDVEQYFGGSVLSVSQSYQHGFYLGFCKQKWALNGWLNLSWGTAEGADSIHLKEFLPEKWHHLVVTYDAKSLALYADGELSGQKDAALNFVGDRGELLAGPMDFKLDQLTVYSATLSAEEIKAHYAKGLPTQSFTAEREARLAALKLQIPRESCGYFQTGQKIPVLIDDLSEADELRVNGEKYSLPLKAAAALSFAAPGLYEIKLALAAQGKTLKKATYPVAIVPFAIHSSKLGARELASRQPEVGALGIKLSRVVADWAELEPSRQSYDWKRLDAVMEKNHELGAETILCLTGLPNWMKLADGSANLPADLAQFKKIVRLLVNRYDGLKTFELWNATCPGNSFKGTPEQKCQDYRVLLLAAAEAVRKDLPDALILAGHIDIGDGIETAAWLQKNAAEWYDIFSAQKNSADPVRNDEKSPWSANITRATTKPVWNTSCGIQQFARTTLLPSEKPEAGTPVQSTWPIPTADEWTGASWQIQDIALQLADGIKRVILETGPSEYSPIDNPTTGLPGMKGLALGVFNGLVGKDAELSRLTDVPAGMFAIRFINPGGYKGLILFTSGKDAAIPVNTTTPGAQLMDLFGKTLSIKAGEIPVSAQPVYLLDVERLIHRGS